MTFSANSPLKPPLSKSGKTAMPYSPTVRTKLYFSAISIARSISGRQSLPLRYFATADRIFRCIIFICLEHAVKNGSNGARVKSAPSLLPSAISAAARVKYWQRFNMLIFKISLGAFSLYHAPTYIISPCFRAIWQRSASMFARNLSLPCSANLILSAFTVSAAASAQPDSI